jgi:hypothetical protein
MQTTRECRRHQNSLNPQKYKKFVKTADFSVLKPCSSEIDVSEEHMAFIFRTED